VDVVVATRDRREALARTLAHLLALPERPRVVVVDNGSRDGTPEMVAREHPEVLLIRLGGNLGCGARTVGARAAEALYVAFSDDDSWWRPGALARAASLLDAHPRLALVAAHVLVGPEEREDPACALMAASPLEPEPDLPGPRVLGFLACGAVVRRAALLEVGGFTARLGVGGEEELLATDLAAAGWGLAYRPDVVAHHHPPPAAPRPARVRTQQRNALWCAWMRRPAGEALALTAAQAGRALRDADARRALMAAVRGAPWALRRRRPVPPALERDLRAVAAARA
jgi:GT2 family glycosyltransferase